MSDGSPAAVLCLIGHGGGEFWPVFETWWHQNPAEEEPLDSWARTVIDPVALAAGGEAVYPSDRPWHPFQQWAMAAEDLKPSPLGLLMHPVYGLWHGYRGAILFRDAGAYVSDPSRPGTVGRSPEPSGRHACDGCLSKPCLSACPVGAFSATGFAVNDCRSHLSGTIGQEGCMQTGCMARDACPFGREFRYSPSQIRFHMRAFA